MLKNTHAFVLKAWVFLYVYECRLYHTCAAAKHLCELLYSFHLLNTFDLTDTKVEQINDDVQGCARISDFSNGFKYGSFLFFNGKSIVYLNIKYSDSLSLVKDYVTEQCVRYLENTK